MATMIRLQRGGRKKRPFYSVVVLDGRKRRDGAFIEKLGYYDPCTEPEVVELNLDRVKAWTDLGAQVSPRVASIIKLAQIDPEVRAKAAANKKAAADKAAADKAAAEKKAAAAEAKAAEKAAAAEAKAAEKAAAEEAVEEAPAEEAAAVEEATTEEAPAEEAVEKADS
ncbi:30S ribosomal protein S16 [Pseudomonadota bacterium]